MFAHENGSNKAPTHQNDEAAASGQPAGHIHFDRITVTGPLAHRPLGKCIYKEMPNSFGLGDLVPAGSEAYKPKAGKSGDPNDIYAQSKLLDSDGFAHQIKLDCCPLLVLQPHNLFGHQDLTAYVYEVFCRQLERHGLTATSQEHSWWRSGACVTLSCLHLTGNHWCDPTLKPLIFDAIDQNNPTGKKRDCPTSLTLGLTPKGTRSEHRMLTIYDKFVLLKELWKTPGEVQQQLLWFAEHSLRAEAKLFDHWLRTYSVDPESGEIFNWDVVHRRDAAAAKRLRPLLYVQNWEFVDVDGLFYRLLDSFPVKNSIQRILSADEQRGLSRGALRMYALWLRGEDLTKYYGGSTISKYAGEIWEKFRIDITSRRRPERLPEVNVADILCPQQLVAVPDFLYETPYFWSPERR